MDDKRRAPAALPPGTGPLSIAQEGGCAGPPDYTLYGEVKSGHVLQYVSIYNDLYLDNLILCYLDVLEGQWNT